MKALRAWEAEAKQARQPRKLRRPLLNSRSSGGETGIRTLGPREGSTVFETAPFDRSGTSPRGSVEAACNARGGAVQPGFHGFSTPAFQPPHASLS